MGSSPGSPSWKWLRPENAQIELVCAGAAVGCDSPTGIPVGEPGPLISPPRAGPAETTAIAAPETAAARNDFMCILHLLLVGQWLPLRYQHEHNMPPRLHTLG